jgi:hypothetical protein
MTPLLARMLIHAYVRIRKLVQNGTMTSTSRERLPPLRPPSQEVGERIGERDAPHRDQRGDLERASMTRAYIGCVRTAR